MHLASLLLGAGHRNEAVAHLGAVLHADPGNVQAMSLLVGAQTADPPANASQTADPPATAPQPADPPATIPQPADPPATAPQPAAAEATTEPEDATPAAAGARASGAEAPASGAESSRATANVNPEPSEFNWAEAEAELRDVLPPMFITPEGAAEQRHGARPLDATAEAAAYDAERPALQLADVAGMADVKARLEAAFLAPMRNPELRKLYGKSLRGGLLLYGPPGCGKTFIARAVAGELGARFMAISFADVVDMYIGSSERNIQEIFDDCPPERALRGVPRRGRRLGQKRSQLRSTPMRSTVNQLLLELDDVTGANEGVFVLAATNHPWDVDSALRRPGRLDRTLLVLPPDEQAREAVFRYHLRDRPVAGIQLTSLAARTDGFSAADIAHICESAAELALLDSARTGQVRMIGQDDLLTAVGQVRPSLGPWFDSARNVALFANEGGSYDDLAAYLKQRKLL